MIKLVSLLNKTVLVTDFSIRAVLLSIAEPIIKVSQTKVFLFFAIANASSILPAYWRISLARMEIGVAEPVGISLLAALMVTVIPFSFIPETQPIKPAHVIMAN